MSEESQTTPEKLWLVLAKCYKSMAEYSRRQVEGSGLGLSDFEVLEALLHKGPLAISSIGAKVLLTSGSMTAAVNRLADLDQRINDGSGESPGRQGSGPANRRPERPPGTKSGIDESRAEANCVDLPEASSRPEDCGRRADGERTRTDGHSSEEARALDATKARKGIEGDRAAP